MKVVCIVGHGDDESFGMGGTLAKLSNEGHQVTVAVLGSSRLCRPSGDIFAAFLEATKVLNVAARGTGGFPDNQFDSLPLLDIVRSVEALLAKLLPEVVYTHWPHDLNVDHRLTAQAVLTATRPAPGHCVRALYSFEVPSSTEWNYTAAPFVPNVFVEVTETMQQKIAALHCYENELRAAPHPRSIESIVARATYWGSTVGVSAAEAFVLLREIQ